MHYALDEFNIIPENARQQLAHAGIHNTDYLLLRAATPKQRQTLAKETRLDEVEISQYCGVADLVRIKGVGPAFAQLIVACGLARNVQELVSVLGGETLSNPNSARLRTAQQESMKQAAAAAAQVLSMRQKDLGLNTRPPSPRELAEIGEEALELRPRIVFPDPQENEDFRQFTWDKYKKETYQSLKISGSILGFLALSIGFLFTITNIYTRSKIKQQSIWHDELGQIGVRLMDRVLGGLNETLIAITLIILAGLLILLAINQIISFLQNTWLVVFMFNRKAYQDYFISISSADLKKRVRASWRAVGIFGLIVLGLLFFYSRMILNDLPMDEFLQKIRLPVSISGVLIGLVVSFPLLGFYWSEYRQKPDFDQTAAQRYLVYYLSKVLVIPVMILLLVWVALPIALRTHTDYSQKHIIPDLRRDILSFQAEIINLEIQDEKADARRQLALKRLEEDILPQIEDMIFIPLEGDSGIFTYAIPVAMNMVIWVALSSYIALFVFPYLLLGGCRRGLLYVLILGVSFFTENVLAAKAPQWFSLPPGSPQGILTIAFFVFANALFLDWVFDRFTERTKPCLLCNQIVDEKDLFCSTCGHVQT